MKPIKSQPKKNTLLANTLKLQKVLADKGLGSRREIEGWIAEGRITVNGKKAKVGDRVTELAQISIDGRRVIFSRKTEKPQILLYHKPVGQVCSRKDEEGRPTIFDNLPKVRGKRWVMVGRLDFNTSGLLLLTTDGNLANRLMHPSNGIEREYAVRLLGKANPEMIKKLQDGVQLEDGVGFFDKIWDAGGEGLNHWYHVVLREGRNRMVRRMWESQGFVVSRLIRVRYGNVTLPRFLRAGKSVDAEPKTIQGIYKLLDGNPG